MGMGRLPRCGSRLSGALSGAMIRPDTAPPAGADPSALGPTSARTHLAYPIAPLRQSSLTRDDYDKLLRYLGYALLVFNQTSALSAPEIRAKAMLAALTAELERREQEMTDDM